ncbi:RING-H2 finger protein ATL8-like protein [Tanacetum coccineum]
MTRPYRILSTLDKPVTEADPPQAAAVESEFVIILAALLCAMICLVSLIAIARCAWLRRGSLANNTREPDTRSANKGLKKKVIEVIPKFKYDSNNEEKGCGKLSWSECAICLGEYVDGDEIRVLPQCGHGFHVGCIDKWLNSHSSCPSCRQILVTTRCKTCGGFPTKTVGDVRLEVDAKVGHCSSSSSSNDYLP